MPRFLSHRANSTGPQRALSSLRKHEESKGEVMKALRRGDRGPAVRRWQLFLFGQGYDPNGVDGIFGGDTEVATRRFQARYRLLETGVVDNATAGQAGALGFEIISDHEDESEDGPNFPPPPDFRAPSEAWRRATFGRFDFVHEPKPNNPENVRITDGWDRENIGAVEIEPLTRIGGPRRSGRIRFNKKGAEQLRSLWAEWDREGFISLVLTWHGSFVPRFQRGSTQKLSNHAYGTAFDINRKWNRYGAIPARVGEEGSVCELVKIANQHGFFWGGHYRRRLDGMHFELAKLL